MNIRIASPLFLVLVFSVACRHSTPVTVQSAAPANMPAASSEPASATPAAPPAASAKPQQTPEGEVVSNIGWAIVMRPFMRGVRGAQCATAPLHAGTSGASFAFPREDDAALSFAIGPESPSDTTRFLGPGQYKEVTVAGLSQFGSFRGVGTVTINADDQSGTFELDDHSAAGRWDCGHRISAQ